MLRNASPSVRIASPANSEISVGSPSPPPPARQRPAQRKSSGDRIKSFSIVDILGKPDEPATKPSAILPTIPVPLIAAAAHDLNILPEHLAAHHAQLLASQPWDHLRGPGPFALHPLFPHTLLHYEQRIAWDYQRQLQEHFQAQAQLLREMSMDPTIIPSENSSERSHSSSTSNGSNGRNTPDLNASKQKKLNGSEHDRKSMHSDDIDEDDEEFEDDEDDDKNNRNSYKSESKQKGLNDTPLDALFQLSTKNFDEEQDPATLNIFATRPCNSKKKRKSRTAFTNHQIFELEKRFLYQKYLSPADRDEIASSLGLSNAQVITWFQNRRAKLKRDMEELKKDVESVKLLPDQTADSKRTTTSSQQHLYKLYQQTATQLIAQQQNQKQRQLKEYQYQQQHQQHQQPQQSALISTYAATQNHSPQLPMPSQRQLADLESRMQQQQQHHTGYQFPMNQVKRVTNTTAHTATEDKKDIKMLKMLTLMYYSKNAAPQPAATTIMPGDSTFHSVPATHVTSALLT